MENELKINAILKAPWLLALLPTIVTLVVTAIKKLNGPLKNNSQQCKECGIPPLILRLSFSRGKLFEMKPYTKANYILIVGFSLLFFSLAGYLTFLSSKAYHESPAGWALLKLTSTNEHFLISSTEATSPDKKTWSLTPQICTSKTYDTIASDIKSSTALVSKLCEAITLKSEQKEIESWIKKVHNGKLKLIIFLAPILITLYWLALSLILDAVLKLIIDKYNKKQAERAELYLT